MDRDGGLSYAGEIAGEVENVEARVCRGPEAPGLVVIILVGGSVDVVSEGCYCGGSLDCQRRAGSRYLSMTTTVEMSIYYIH